MPLQRNKYRNRKITVNGIIYESQKEYKRHKELMLLERAGQITRLERQVKFELIPSQKIGSKVVERACSYIADFVYMEYDSKKEILCKVVEDTKGFRTPEYIIKRKLMLWVHGIRIREI
jgi:hypothetical protein